MVPHRDCAPAGCTVEARGTTRTVDATDRTAVVAAAQDGKWLAITLCNSGVADMGATEAAFALHPDWAAA